MKLLKIYWYVKYFLVSSLIRLKIPYFKYLPTPEHPTVTEALRYFKNLKIADEEIEEDK